MRKISIFIVVFIIALNVMNSILSFASSQLNSSDKVSEEQLLLDIKNQTDEVKNKIKLVKKENEDIRKINKDYEKKYKIFRKLANKRDSNVNVDNAKTVDNLHKEIFNLQKKYKEIQREMYKKRKNDIDNSAKEWKELRADNKIVSDDEYKKIIEKYKSDKYLSQFIAFIKIRLEGELDSIDNKNNIYLKIHNAEEELEKKIYLLDTEDIELKENKDINAIYIKMDSIMSQYVE